MARLLAPSSLAVVGSTRTCEQAVRASRRLGFAGDIVAVHPSGKAPACPAVATVAELREHFPNGPDAAFVAVPAAHTVGIIRDLAAIGCGGAVTYSSGFAEVGPEGRELQDRLVAAAGDMPMLGPNCYGMLNYADGVAIWPDEHGGRALAPGQRGVAVISQSSSIAISMTMNRIGLPISYVLTVGNGAMLGAAQLATSLVTGGRVTAIGMLVESLSDVRGLEAMAAAARQARVPIVALVLGRSEQARRVAISHSASMAGDAATGSDLLARLGIGEATSVDTLLGTLSLLHCGGPLPGRRLTSLSCSGGEASLIADAAVDINVDFPQLTPRQREGLSEALGPRVTLDNPLDYHTYVWTDRPAMARAFAAMVGDESDLNLFFADLPRDVPDHLLPAHPVDPSNALAAPAPEFTGVFPGPGVPVADFVTTPPTDPDPMLAGAERDVCNDADWVMAVDAFRDALAATGARGLVVAAMGANLQGPRVRGWVADGLPAIAPPHTALAAASAAADIGAAWAGPAPAPSHGPRPPVDADQLVVLDEPTGKALLRDAGVPVPPGRLCQDLSEVAAVAAELGGPLVVKGTGLAHKSEADAVRIGLPDAAAAVEAADELLTRCPAVLVERMVADVVAELLVGVDVDPTFGPVLTLGAGGVLTEVLRDITRMVLPVSREVLRERLSALRCAPLLAGFRGRPEADLEAVLDAIEAIAALGARADLHGVEVNPLLALADGACAVDALVVTRADMTVAEAPAVGEAGAR